MAASWLDLNLQLLENMPVFLAQRFAQGNLEEAVAIQGNDSFSGKGTHVGVADLFTSPTPSLFLHWAWLFTAQQTKAVGGERGSNKQRALGVSPNGGTKHRNGRFAFGFPLVSRVFTSAHLASTLQAGICLATHISWWT